MSDERCPLCGEGERHAYGIGWSCGSLTGDGDHVLYYGLDCGNTVLRKMVEAQARIKELEADIRHLAERLASPMKRTPLRKYRKG